MTDRPLVALNVMVRDNVEGFRNLLKTATPYVDEIIVAVDERSENGGAAHFAALADLAPPGVRLVAFPTDWCDDFSYVRNQCLAQTTAQTMIWLDADDVLVGGERLREVCQKLLEDETAPGVLLWYDYTFDQHGNIIHRFLRERIIRVDDGWQWRSRVHETLANPITQEKPAWHICGDELKVVHAGWNGDSRNDRNMRLLTLQLADSVPAGVTDPAEMVKQTNDPRTLLYLGNQHLSGMRFNEAAFFYRAFVDWVKHGEGRTVLTGERWQAYKMLGDCYQHLREYAQAFSAYTMAEMIRPLWPDSWIGKADVMLAMERIVEAEGYTMRAIQLINEGHFPDPTLFPNHVEYKIAPCTQMAFINAHLGNWDIAEKFATMGLSVQPDNDRLKDILMAIRVERRHEDEAEAAITLLEGLLRSDDPIRANNFYHELPDYLKPVPRVRELYERAHGQVSHLMSAEAYEGFYQENPGWFPTPDEGVKEWRAYARLKAIADMVGENKTVLDLGSSDGILHPMLADIGSTITAVDIDFRCLKEAKERAQRLGYADRLTVQQGMAEKVLDDFRAVGQRFDVVVMGELLEHVIDVDTLLEKAEMVADRVVITVPDEAFDKGELEGWDTEEPRGHVRTFTRDTLAEVLLKRTDNALIDYRPPRRIWELFRLNGGSNRGWLAAAYTLGQAEGPYAAIYCGPGLERWSPLNYRWTGIGGSETAVVRVAGELAKQGWNVRVFAEADGVWDGVQYKRYEDASPELLSMSDLLVLWRSPDAFRVGLIPNNYAGKIALWLHDVDCGDRLTPELAAQIDYILYLSEWHRRHLLERYPWLDADLLVRTWNGIDEFDVSGIEREPHRLMWASSPDRGLDVILENWSKIRAVWPDAEIHCYYGWDNIEKFAAFNPKMLDFKKSLEPLLSQEGVFWHGRVTAKELRKAWAKSSIFLYPPPKTGFKETFCISVLEAQAAGCVPIVHDGGALPETLGRGGVLGAKDATFDSMINALYYFDCAPGFENDGIDPMSDIRKEARANAAPYTWARVAESFAALAVEPVRALA